MELIIERDKWLRGEGYERSFLLREEDGKMCCLGFFCLQTGASQEDINQYQTPIDIKKEKRADWLIQSDAQFIVSEACSSLMEINDEIAESSSAYVSEAEREKD